MVQAFTAAQPEIWGRVLQPVTIAHIIALEKIECQLVLNWHPPRAMDALLALLVLALPGDAALKAAQHPDSLRARAESLAQEHTPADLAHLIKVVGEWLTSAYATRIQEQAEGEAPLAQRPAGKDSVGQSNS